MQLPFKLKVSLRLIWVLMALLSLGSCLVSIGGLGDKKPMEMVGVLLFVLQVGGWVYVSLRLARFYPRMRAFFRRLLANDYEAGVRDGGWVDDEVTDLVRLANRAADRLRSYDLLRGERTGLSYRAMDLLFRSSNQAMILADMGKQQFRFNPAAQLLYGVKQEVFTFESIESQPANRRFFRAFLLATLRDGVGTDGAAVLQLPQRETSREIAYRLEPLKDKSEKVRLAFLFVSLTDEPAP